MTKQEIELDQAAEIAMKNHQDFRNKHWEYFYSTETIGENGEILPRVRNRALDNKSMELFNIAREANKKALDAEYNTRFGV
jgi:hypothetical protein